MTEKKGKLTSGRVTVNRDAMPPRDKKTKAKPVPFATFSNKKAFPSPPKARYDEYGLSPGGVLIRNTAVEPSAIAKGIEKAKKQIQSMIAEFAKIVVGGGHKITEIELSVSFDASGKFLGVGVSGATSIKIKITPLQ